MSSATLSLNDAYAAAATAAPGSTVSDPLPAVAASTGASAYLTLDAGVNWLRRPGIATSALIHGGALLAIWGLSGSVKEAPSAAPVVELIRLAPEPKQEIVPPKPEPVKDKPVALAPPKPVAAAVPTPKTVETSAAQAETYTPPAPPVQAAPIGPVTPAVPAPPAAPTPAPVAAVPRQIGNEGIPTDYVNQVYARINSNTDYPREAKMRRQQGRVAYRLTLNPQGALISFDIQSSGVEALDEAAREAIRRAAPFPRLPDLGGSTYLLAGNIVFKIN